MQLKVASLQKAHQAKVDALKLEVQALRAEVERSRKVCEGLALATRRGKEDSDWPYRRRQRHPCQ